MNLTLKNLGVNVAYYAVSILLVPWVLLTLEDICRVSRYPNSTLRTVAFAFGAAGVALQAWCIVLFQRLGRGTPSPAFPPTRLVTQGPYRWVRNPMNLGEWLLFLALTGWFASPALLLCTALGSLAHHVFVVRWEEPKLLARFGDEYARYRATVNRWLPKAPNARMC